MKYLIIAIALLISSISFAGGDKNRTNSIILDSNTNVIGLPSGITEEDCIDVTAPEQAGISVLFCVSEYFIISTSDD